MIATEVFNLIRDRYPEDDIDQIHDWYDQATTCYQPITLDEYTDWRQYDECGKLVLFN